MSSELSACLRKCDNASFNVSQWGSRDLFNNFGSGSSLKVGSLHEVIVRLHNAVQASVLSQKEGADFSVTDRKRTLTEIENLRDLRQLSSEKLEKKKSCVTRALATLRELPHNDPRTLYETEKLCRTFRDTYLAQLEQVYEREEHKTMKYCDCTVISFRDFLHFNETL